jgi:flagellar motor switch protein FliM
VSDEQPETPAGTPTDQPPADPAQMIEPAQDGAPAPDAVDPGAMDMAAAMGGEARQLSQDEIDNLLGMDAAAPAEEAGGQSGMQAIINSGMVTYERLPMLEVVFDRLTRLLTTSLRNFTSDNVEVSIDNLTSVRFGDYLNAIPLPALLTVFKAQEWDNFGLVTVDSALIYSVVDVLLGGRRAASAMRIEGRPYTTIERRLVETLVGVILNDLTGAFDPVCTCHFKSDRLETNPRFATIARPANAAMVAKLRVDMEDRGGRFEIVLPYATFEPVRELLLQRFMGEKFGRDNIWEGHLANELWHTEIKIDAVLDEQTMSLNDILQLKVGSRLMLSATPASDIQLRCGPKAMFVGSMGRRGSNMAIRVEQKVKHQEAM